MSSKITIDKVYDYLIDTGKLAEDKETTFSISDIDTDIPGYINIEVTYETKGIRQKTWSHVEVSEYRKWCRTKRLNTIIYGI